MPAQAVKQFIGHFHGRLCHGHGITQNQFLQLTEGVAGLEVGQREQLLFRQAELSAHGRTDIDSEWTADQGRGLD